MTASREAGYPRRQVYLHKRQSPGLLEPGGRRGESGMRVLAAGARGGLK